MVQKLPKGWEVRKLGEITDIFKGGTPKRSVERYFQGDIAWAIPTDITKLNGALYIDDTETHISEEGLSRSAARMLPPGTVLWTSRATIGKVAISRIPIATNQGFANFLCKEEINNIFLAYYLKLKKGMLISLGTGTTFLEVTKARLLEVEILLPPLPTQRKIAAVLSAYDDLIENNTRRIKILEDMAQTLYQEWFVHFRFPGHEKVPMVESSLGLIPQGWEVKQLGEVAQLHRGRSYRSINLVEDGEGLPFLNLKNINREGGFRPDGLKWYDGEFKETQVASSNDIIMALTDVTQDRKVVARSARVPDLGYEKYVLSMDLLRIEPIELIQMDFLYALLKYSSFPQKLKEYANGTTVLHLSPNHVQSSELVLPPNILRQRYAEVAMSIRQQSDLLEKKNVSLRQTRDLLLPKLISGEIDISELDIDTAPKSN